MREGLVRPGGRKRDVRSAPAVAVARTQHGLAFDVAADAPISHPKDVSGGIVH